jgi:pimeloyl-ACP methyl ester carboxylesterase
MLTGLEARRITVGDADIFARIGGSGPPLLMLHGFPQTHVCWTRSSPSSHSISRSCLQISRATEKAADRRSPNCDWIGLVLKLASVASS